MQLTNMAIEGSMILAINIKRDYMGVKVGLQDLI